MYHGRKWHGKWNKGPSIVTLMGAKAETNTTETALATNLVYQHNYIKLPNNQQTTNNNSKEHIVCMHACMRVCMWGWGCTHVNACVRECMSACMPACVCGCVHVCACLHACVNACMCESICLVCQVCTFVHDHVHMTMYANISNASQVTRFMLPRTQHSRWQSLSDVCLLCMVPFPVPHGWQSVFWSGRATSW